MYAIRNKRTGKWLYGSWHQDGRIIQRTSEDNAMIFKSFEDAKFEFIARQCGKSYEIVPVRLEKLEGEQP